MSCLSAKSLRAAFLAAAAIAAPALVGVFPASAQDWQHRPPSPVLADQAAVSAARTLLESSGGIKNVEAVFPRMADQLQRLAQNDPIFKNVKFDVRQMALRLLKEGQEEFITQAAKAYAVYLTAEEMQRLTAFFRGPLGARFQLLPEAFAANHNVDRKIALDEAATSIGFSPAEKAELVAYMRTADCQKFLRSQPVILATMKETAGQWGTRIAKEILDAAMRERSSQSGISART